MRYISGHDQLFEEQFNRVYIGHRRSWKQCKIAILFGSRKVMKLIFLKKILENSFEPVSIGVIIFQKQSCKKATGIRKQL